MPILFFDTETTGLPDKRAAVGASHQPHIVQLAAILTDDDGTERASINIIVNPGVPIPKGASDVHGISDEMAKAFGIAPKRAAIAFKGLLLRATKLVAHNITFDQFLVETLCSRTGVEIEFPKQCFCTMEAATPVLNLPPTDRMKTAGFNKPKPPKLAEAYQHFFGRALEGAHDALVDVRACRDVFFALKLLESVEG